MRTSPPNPVSLNPEEKRLLYTLASVQFTHIVDSMVLMPLGPMLMRLFEIGPAQFGWLVSAYTWSASFTAILGSSFIDRFSRKRVLSTVYVGFLVGTLACAIAPSYSFLFAARAWTGAFGGLLGGMALSLVGDYVAESQRGAAVGVVMMGFSLAAVIGVPMSLIAASAFGWHAPFLAIVAVGILVFVQIRRSVPAEPIRPAARIQVPLLSFLGAIVRDHRQTLALTLMFTLTFAHFLIIPFISTSLVFNAAFPESALPLVYLTGGSVTFFSSPYIGRLADRYGRFQVFALCLLFSLLAVVGITNLRPAPVWMVLIVTICFFIFGNGRLVVSLALITSAPPASSRGGFLVVNSSVQSAASGLAAYVSSILLVREPSGALGHYDQVGYFSVVVALTALLTARSLQRSLRSS